MQAAGGGHSASMLNGWAWREKGVSHDIQMVNKLPVLTLAIRECTSILWYKAVLGALGIDEQVWQ